MTFKREDWTLFRSLNTIGQKAGVSLARLPLLVAKELADNAIDAAGSCTFGFMDPDGDGDNDGFGFYVQDSGKGIGGSDDDVADLFSIRRLLTSSKLLRLPTRGSMGNGLRVVAGAVLASRGSLRVSTRDRTLTLSPQDDGTTRVIDRRPWAGSGTRIEVRLGPDLPVDDNVLSWADIAVRLAGRGTDYKGRSSPHWYDSEAFFELVSAAPASRSVRDVVAELEGCGGKKTGQACGGHAARVANSLRRDEATEVLRAARDQSRESKPERLGSIGRMKDYTGYAIRKTTFYSPGGLLRAHIPCVIEVWARQSDQPKITLCVNRSPVCAEVTVRREGRTNEYAVFGCGLAHGFTVTKAAEFELLINVQSPHMPLVTDGKQPDLTPVLRDVIDCLEKAARTANRKGPRDKARGNTQKAVILANLDGAMEKVSGGRRHRYSLRQLFYAVRPHLLAAFGEEPDYGYFADKIKEYERGLGHDLLGIYRDNRGTLYHPHLRQEIPLGTRMVEGYERPAWTFNKVLYAEKEGLFPILRDADWPERHDCALLTSKGFATFAVRDLLNLLDQSGEPITIFCIHDADGPGTLIYEELLEGVRDRSGREINVINLGLEPAEAVEMGLVIEPVSRKDGKRVAVAEYVDDRWREWLQSNRSELNAMTSPEFLDWLDRKIAPFDVGKVIPPRTVMAARLQREVQDQFRREITNRILQKARIDAKVERATTAVRHRVVAETRTLKRSINSGHRESPARSWADIVGDLARRLVGAGASG